MRDVISILASLIVIPILTRKKAPLWVCMIIAGTLMAFISGRGVNMLWDGIVSMATLNTLAAVAVVTEITILGGLMKHYGLLDRITALLVGVFRNRRSVIMLMPMLIGLLAVPGGAIMSVPVVDDMGQQLDIPGGRRASINVVFRHILGLFMPYTSSMLLTASFIPEMNIRSLMLYNAVFALGNFLIGYFFLVRGTGKNSPTPEGMGDTFKRVLELIWRLSPLYISVVLNLALNIPLWVGMFISILLVLFMCDRKDFIKSAARGFNLSMVLAMVSVYYIQAMVRQLTGIQEWFTTVFASNYLVSVGIGALALGLVSGYQPLALSILVPLIGQAGLPAGSTLVLVFLAFMGSSIGYLVSPLHMCLVFTCQGLHVEQRDIYRDKGFIWVLIGLVALLVLLTLGGQFLLA